MKRAMETSCSRCSRRCSSSPAVVFKPMWVCSSRFRSTWTLHLLRLTPLRSLLPTTSPNLLSENVLDQGPTRMHEHWERLPSSWRWRAQRLEHDGRLLHEAMDRHVAKIPERKRLLLCSESSSSSLGPDVRKISSMQWPKSFDFAPRQRRRARSLEPLWRSSRDIRASILRVDPAVTVS